MFDKIIVAVFALGLIILGWRMFFRKSPVVAPRRRAVPAEPEGGVVEPGGTDETTAPIMLSADSFEVSVPFVGEVYEIPVVEPVAKPKVKRKYGTRKPKKKKITASKK